MKPSNGPWKPYLADGDAHEKVIVNAQGRFIARCGTDWDAAHIVACVNEFAAMSETTQRLCGAGWTPFGARTALEGLILQRNRLAEENARLRDALQRAEHAMQNALDHNSEHAAGASPRTLTEGNSAHALRTSDLENE